MIQFFELLLEFEGLGEEEKSNSVQQVRFLLPLDSRKTSSKCFELARPSRLSEVSSLSQVPNSNTYNDNLCQISRKSLFSSILNHHSTWRFLRV